MKEPLRYFRALTIAGSDSGGGAGIQADLKTFAALECYGLSVVCALTAQNTRGVTDIFEVSPAFVAAQLDAVLEDIGADAVKVGMLQSPAIVSVVAERLRRSGLRRIVLDPVMVSKSGHLLLTDAAVEALRRDLLPLAAVVTPNLPEAERLTGLSVQDPDGMQAAGEALLEAGAAAVLVKGGHLARGGSDDCLCLRAAGGAVTVLWFPQPRIETRNTHGTGCTLSSAIAAHLARGFDIAEAVASAKAYLTRALQEGAGYALGSGHGPVHHFAGRWRGVAREEG